MKKPDDYGGGNASNPYCKHCTDAQGNLLPRETVRQNMINFYNKTMGQTQEQAAVEVDKIMAKTPAWQGQTQSATPEPPVAEPSPAPEPEMPAEVPSEPPVPPVAPTDQPTEPSVPEPTAPVPEPTTPGQPVKPSEAVEPVVPTQPEEKTPTGQEGVSS